MTLVTASLTVGVSMAPSTPTRTLALPAGARSSGTVATMQTTLSAQPIPESVPVVAGGEDCATARAPFWDLPEDLLQGL